MLLSATSPAWSRTTLDIICQWMLPIGYFLLLAGLIILPEKGVYHQSYYLLIVLPCLVASILQPSIFKPLFREPILWCFLILMVWTICSLGWTASDESVTSLIKRPLLVFFLFIATILLAVQAPRRLHQSLLAAAIAVLIATLISLALFYQNDPPEQRMIGIGALTNPLLSSHLFGFFCVYWIALAIERKAVKWTPLLVLAAIVMLLAVLATGSRTPILALCTTLVWILIMRPHRWVLSLLTILVISLIVIFAFKPELILIRGASYRPELWQLSLQYIAEHPWFGHGFDAPLKLDVGLSYLLEEPHNFLLSVLFNLGIVGLIPWLVMYLFAITTVWRQRYQPHYLTASVLLIYGLAASMTEGGSIFSRPKEHWLIVWIPIALIAALHIAQRVSTRIPFDMQRLSHDELSDMLRQSRIIEEDGLGPKVVALKDGCFLKIFRQRRKVSSASLFPYARRFAVNCLRLAGLGIQAPHVHELFRLDDITTAIRYEPLPGQTLRQMLADDSDPRQRRELIRHFGQFLAKLHESGVYFRSLHLGNVVLDDHDTFGLIDVADMRIFPAPLGRNLRLRNLRHMQRYPDDQHWLFEENLDSLLEGYGQIASHQLTEAIHQYVITPV